MSWQDNIDSIVFTIITGDGKTYTPKWKNAQRSIEYNSALFEFVNVAGTLVLRQEPKGMKYDLEFYFDGENAIINGNNFEISARNKKYWQIKHPFYGNFIAQPVNLNQDNSQLNCSKFAVTVIETLSDVYPVSLPIIEDRISESNAVTNELQSSVFANSGEIDKTELLSNVNTFDIAYSKLITLSEDLQGFKNLVSNAIIELQSATSTPLTIIRTIIALINYPATIAQSVNARISTYEETLNLLFDSLNGSRESKFRYETLSGAMVGAILVSSSVNITDDYETRAKVFAIQARIAALYGTLIQRLDTLQTDRADSDDSFTPSFNSMNSLNQSVNYTISNLFSIAFSAKQEREFVVDYDTNLVLLTHRFYRLDLQDENINKFISTNNIGINEMLCISKGRKIIYYV